MIETIFCLLVMYQVKHFLADYPFQTEYMLGKFKDGWAFVAPLTAHCGVHSIFTFLISATFLLYFKKNPFFAFGLAGFDFVAHFIMDRIKASPKLLGRFKALSGNDFMELRRKELEVEEQLLVAERANPPTHAYQMLAHIQKALIIKSEIKDKKLNNKMFWISLGIDQQFHHLTHYAIIWFLVSL